MEWLLAFWINFADVNSIVLLGILLFLLYGSANGIRFGRFDSTVFSLRARRRRHRIQLLGSSDSDSEIPSFLSWDFSFWNLRDISVEDLWGDGL